MRGQVFLLQNALLEVIGHLNRVRSIPKEVDRPALQLGGGAHAG